MSQMDPERILEALHVFGVNDLKFVGDVWELRVAGWPILLRAKIMPDIEGGYWLKMNYKTKTSDDALKLYHSPLNALVNGVRDFVFYEDIPDLHSLEPNEGF